jgi:hypothetical protein
MSANIKRILATDRIPLFFGRDDNNKQFIGWVFRDSAGGELGVIENIWYETDESYRMTDGYFGCAYKLSLSMNGVSQTFKFRHINNMFEKLEGAFELVEP